MSFGIKVSKSGYDVKTADETQLVYSSVYSCLKIHSIVTGTVILSGEDLAGSVVIDNPLSYPPIFLGFLESYSVAPGKWKPATTGLGSSVWPADADVAYAQVDYRPATNDFLAYISHTGLGIRTFNFRILVFTDTPTLAASTEERTGYGLAVSEEWVDVRSALRTEMSVDSDYPSLTIASTSTLSVPSTGGMVHTEQYAHGLGYVPIFMTWISDGGDYFQQPCVGYFNGGLVHSECWADDTNIYVSGFGTTHPIVVFDQPLVGS